MLGLRGCRLLLCFPEICEMQSRAIFGAAAEALRQGQRPLPELMVPLVASAEEFQSIKEQQRGLFSPL